MKVKIADKGALATCCAGLVVVILCFSPQPAAKTHPLLGTFALVASTIVLFTRGIKIERKTSRN